ncbi:hypothetical protein BO221_42120 [Archangium sp. Cb G35]|uniref:hypothetical protein n=1 Tax=Archangium sp. Cb G35 TaxID=1920190 RepID=UPI0009373290|nr:hypothetical protein [Archangium sp. Cb G35]OJT18091.1 hypothetical protein BO221_42120 [Archangium sp. Cb G35]
MAEDTEDDELKAKRWAWWLTVSSRLEEASSWEFLWRLRVLWGTQGPTAKQAALLRQFIPEFKGRSITEVGEWLAGTAWKEWRMLFAVDARRLQQEAEARGFRVEAVQDGLDDPAVAHVRSLLQAHSEAHPEAARYWISFLPSFHEGGCILVTLGPGESLVSVASRAHHETVPVPDERGLRFLEELAAIDPLGVPGGNQIGLDGISLSCLVEERQGRREFSTWSPDPKHYPREHGFVWAVYQLAADAAREPATCRFLEEMFGYLNNNDERLPVKHFDEVPRRIRLFGSLSSMKAKALEALFASVSPDEPLLMDLSSFEGMGTSQYPLFARFHTRPGRTAWWVNKSATRHLLGAGIPRSHLHDTLDAARAALLDASRGG